MIRFLGVTLAGLAISTAASARPTFFGMGSHIVPRVAGVPEPSTWAMMLVGMLGVGYALRRRAKVVA